MAHIAPTNLRATKRDIGFGYVMIEWDDPNVDTKNVAVLLPGSSGAQRITADAASRSAVVRGGMDVIVELGDGVSSAQSSVFTVPAATSSNGLTARQHLEAAMGVPFPAGTVVGRVSVDPQRTVQADGSLA